ncbi:hypothetical protein [Aeromicrobium sp. Sec7.5]|uniref:hypothetical protein n=1 Tax=Aeromicrobium sp. Sec7.5 TaxID=3121276 RepID=UPI002FE43E23
MSFASARRRLVAAFVAGLAIALAPAVETSAAPSSTSLDSYIDMSTLPASGSAGHH